ncbi:MAG: general stress protein [Nodosilinea sp.]
MTSQHRRAVGVFPDRPKTASALQALSDSGFAMSHVSVIAKDPDRQNAIAGVKVKDEASNQADTGGTVGAVTGGVLGGVTGLLVGLGTLVIPGLGPAMLAGEAAAVLSTLVGGAAGAAAGGLVGALIGMGIPEHRAKHYRDRIAQGDYLVMLKDTEPEIARAERTLKASGIEDWGVYHAADDASSARAGSPNTTFNGDAPLPGTNPNHGQLDQSGVAVGRDNPYNRVDHPMDQGYPHRETSQQGTVPAVTGLPHASNPVEPR